VPRELDELFEKLDRPDADLQALGDEASRISNAMRRRAGHVPKRGNRRAVGARIRADAFFPVSLDEYIRGGGIFKLERIAVAHVRDEALRSTRERWLPIIERWAADEELELGLRAFLMIEVRRLRRCLGLRSATTGIEEKRAQTRERVRRHRARQSKS
jgi:hypothetical protein